MQCALFYAKHTDKFMFLKHNLLVFQVRTNKVQDYDLLGSWCYSFLGTYNIPAAVVQQAVLLTCLENIPQTYPFYCSYYIPELHYIPYYIRNIVLLPF